jgi:hypothetical protein
LDEGNEWFNDFCRSYCCNKTLNFKEKFSFLSQNQFELLKVAKYEMPVYVQFCPMANGVKVLTG